ncbi:uncharacterized protein G2W53_014936 [Senna tora]|uniref:Uncharacterized protein n=1 Tax=Senna tora TaxID=362788 RepID=A0A834WV42_9FABA|nr:uncharacterized protein G2W53_014936 [Senna tora]
MATNRSLGIVISLHQISRCRRLVAADLAGENAEVLRESEGEEAFAAAEEEVFGLELREKIFLLICSSDDFKSVKIFESQ